MIDLFAGAGGMTAGFVRAGYEPVYAVDLDPDAAATYRENFGAHIDAVPIEDVPDVRFPAADVVVGGPPCQGFSSLGRMNGKGANTALNDLWSEYTRVVESVRPAIFVVENVPQFLRSAEFDALRRRSETLHYEIAAGVLNSAEFGVPQKRRRAFVIGSRVGSPTLPEPLGGPEHTVHDAVGHLRPPEGQGSVLKPGVVSRERDLHFRRTPTELSLRRYALIPPGGNRLDLAEESSGTDASLLVEREARQQYRRVRPATLGRACSDHSDGVFQAREGAVPPPGARPIDHAPRGRAASDLRRGLPMDGLEDLDRSADRKRRAAEVGGGRRPPRHRSLAPPGASPIDLGVER